MNISLPPWQALALWELILVGDGIPPIALHTKIVFDDVKSMERLDLITISDDDPIKVYLTDRAYLWAQREGFTARLAEGEAVAVVFQALLAKLGAFMKVRGVPLAHVLRPDLLEGMGGEAPKRAKA